MVLSLESLAHLGGGFLQLPNSMLISFGHHLSVCLPHTSLNKQDIPRKCFPSIHNSTADQILLKLPIRRRSLASRPCLHDKMSTEVSPAGEPESSISRTPCCQNAAQCKFLCMRTAPSSLPSQVTASTFHSSCTIQVKLKYVLPYLNFHKVQVQHSISTSCTGASLRTAFPDLTQREYEELNSRREAAGRPPLSYRDANRQARRPTTR